MRIGKTKMFLLLNGSIAMVLVCYFGFWLMSKTTVAHIIPPYNANTINIQYVVKGKVYTNNHLRSDIPFHQLEIAVHYSFFNPASSRINSYMGLYAEPLAWWLVFLMASAMLLLMPNTVFSTGTIFQLEKKFPWISMDEYFPGAGQRYRNEKKTPPQVKKIKRLEQGHEPPKISTSE
jgi:hypothetical protein